MSSSHLLFFIAPWAWPMHQVDMTVSLLNQNTRDQNYIRKQWLPNTSECWIFYLIQNWFEILLLHNSHDIKWSNWCFTLWQHSWVCCLMVCFVHMKQEKCSFSSIEWLYEITAHQSLHTIWNGLQAQKRVQHLYYVHVMVVKFVKCHCIQTIAIF